MTCMQSEPIPGLNLPLGTVVAKINYFKEMRVNAPLKSWQDGETIQSDCVKQGK